MTKPAFGLLVILILSVIWGALLVYAFDGDSEGSSDVVLPSENCYFVRDTAGREYRSKAPAFLGDVGVYWSTDQGWGVVVSPAGWGADKDCLRRRGVEVPDS